ncbi:myosin-11-like isoform X2 [Acanthaster planci]|nr:myosin-11-like isoform X2 [Acanthaster planci]XP_022095535.1 myosin-11-like isoform X2 [Acanthaster planci]XP_022095536.1 myosin-11-like isoform X2 [Acanthaster planci]
MSRVSRDSFVRDASLASRRRELQREVSASPNRRSSRLAKKYGVHESSYESRVNQSQTLSSLQVSHNESHSTTNMQTASSSSRFEEDEATSSADSVWPSSASTVASSASQMASSSRVMRGSGATARGGTYQVQREHSINHMYGLDANEESEISDTESSSAVTSGLRYRTSGRWGTVDHSHHTQSSSTLFFPLSFIVTVVTSLVSVITTVTYTSYTFLARAVYGSSTETSASTALTSSVSSRIAYACSNLVQLTSIAVYRCVTYLMCVDVWWLIFTKRTTLGLLGGLASLLGLGSVSQAGSAAAAAAMTPVMLREKERKRRSCCLCLFLLLGTLASSYLLLAAAPFLLAAVSRNETKTDSPLHPVEEQLGLLLGKMGSTSEADGDGSTAAFIAGSGCLQCLKQDDLLALIGAVVKGQLKDLQSEVMSQKQLILNMQQLRIDQEVQIKNLQDQIGLLMASQDRPNDRTLLYLNTMEGQLTRVKGQLRNLQLSQLQGERDSERDGLERSAIFAGLSSDLQTHGKEVASLQTELESFREQQVLEMNKAQQEGKDARRELHSLHATVLSWEERLAVNVTFLETKLKGLLNDIEQLKSDERQSNAKLEQLVERVNSFELGFSDVKTEVHTLRSKFGDLLAKQEKIEKTEAVDLSLQLLRNDFASSREKTLDSLKELQSKYQTLSGSLDGMQKDIKHVHASLGDLESQQVGTLISEFKQLNAKLAKLESDFNSLQANFLTLQGTASGTAATNGLEGLRVSISKAEEQLNVFAIDVDSLNLQLTQLRKQLEDIGMRHEEHRSQAGATFQDLRHDMEKLNAKSDLMVKQLAEDLGAGRLSQPLEGDRDLLTEVNSLKESLTSAKSQINYFDTTQMQMTRTFTSSISDLRNSVSEVNRAIEDQKAAVVALNSTVVYLQQGQDRLGTFATRKQLEDLEIEMTNIKMTVSKLAAAQSVYASTGDVEALKSRISDVRLQIETMQAQLTEMSNTYVGEAASYTTLTADLAKMQATITQLEAILYDADHRPMNLSLLDSRISALTSMVQDNDKNLAAFLADGAMRESTSSNEAVVTLQRELAAVKSDTDSLLGMLYLQGAEGESTSVVAALLDRVTAVESTLAGMKASGVGAGQDIRFQRLQGDINSLKEDMMRQNALHSAGAGLGVLGASIQDDMKEAKANITRLQVDVYKCCKNKTGLLGWWNSAWFGGSQGSSTGTVNLSTSGNMDEEAVRHIVLSALNMYSADKTGMVDYALESAGGSVISTRCSETHYSKTALLSIFGIPLWYMANSPRTVIQPDVQPGNCWAFKGTHGYMVIQLAGIIKPSAFSMEHIPKSLSPTGTIESAPKEFSVWGLQDEEDTEGVLLGEYIYDQDGSPLQFFPIEKSDVEPIPVVELKIHSNHGNLEYTCLYRFRVHGTLDRR